MNNKLDEVKRLFNVMFPSYVMTYKQECDPLMDIIMVSINDYYHIKIPCNLVLRASVKDILSELTHLFVDLKINEVKK